MNKKVFLSRIGFEGKVSNSFESLTKLQECFLGAIPFENIDIIEKKPLDFSTSKVFDKIVTHKRGGVCFENNSLFFSALRALGFDVRVIEAEMFPGASFKGHFDHMSLIVTLDEVEYLVDVGNGKYFGDPISIHSHAETTGEECIHYKVMRYGISDFVLCFNEADTWKYRYAFRLASKNISDFQQVSHFIETSPESIFTQKLLVTVYKHSQRITLSGDRLLITDQSGLQTEKVVQDSEQAKVLKGYFGISA
ncbi:arylamine N-acetyltransferase family protein [Shewanella surugensis]|uniref:Arylamine N-acetyltransferase n=1 Tax=Shewanella surugensis TaxID=212020 RepID=A0ABT0LI38_9GAMM|nr:arylamine N-acetyltransferase [Shewanella surugensis]MCL1127369.1 arylamine N-acetyltransferase [Shewanella surugensis]